MKISKIYILLIVIFLLSIFFIALKSNSQTSQSQNSIKPLNLEIPQNSQGKSNSLSHSWTLDFPDETGMTQRRIIPSLTSLFACRTKGNQLSPNDYFCSRDCKSVNVGYNADQELCDVSCTATRCNYVDTGKPYTEE